MEPLERSLEYPIDSLGSILKAPPQKTPRGAFNILPRESIGYSRDLLRGSIHHNIPKAFPQIVILSGSQTNQVKKTFEQH